MDPTNTSWRTEITAMNGSLTPRCETVDPTLSFLIFLISLPGLARNAIVRWLLGFHMSRNAFTVCVLNLAVADFLLLCSHVVFSLDSIIHLILSTSIHIPRFFIVMLTFAYLAGLGVLSATNTERCMSVVWPIWYQCRRPRHASAVMCALLWALSLFLSLLEGEECGYLFKGFGFDLCQTLDVIIDAWVVFLFMVLFGSSLALLVRIFCGSQQFPVTRLYVTIALTVLAYLLFGLPFGINWFILAWIDSFYYNAPCIFYHVITFLACDNSCVNPITYFFTGSIKHRRFQRRILKLLLQRALQDTLEEEVSEDCGSSGKSREEEKVSCSS